MLRQGQGKKKRNSGGEERFVFGVSLHMICRTFLSEWQKIEIKTRLLVSVNFHVCGLNYLINTYRKKSSDKVIPTKWKASLTTSFDTGFLFKLYIWLNFKTFCRRHVSVFTISFTILVFLLIDFLSLLPISYIHFRQHLTSLKKGITLYKAIS